MAAVSTSPPRLDEATALARAHGLAARPGIALLGLTGPPGAGKSMFAERLVDTVPGSTLVGMDGFHLAHAALERLGRAERKGGPDTFDGAGYVALLRRIRALEAGDRAQTVWAPRFHREIEDAIAGEVAVDVRTTLVVTEGNYLLLEAQPWRVVKELLDECWYLDVDDDVRRNRLQARHERFGRSPVEARDRTWGSDERNAELVGGSRTRADFTVTAAPPPPS
jgi:pantothenate kinase